VKHLTNKVVYLKDLHPR